MLDFLQARRVWMGASWVCYLLRPLWLLALLSSASIPPDRKKSRHEKSIVLAHKTIFPPTPSLPGRSGQDPRKGDS